MTFEYRHFNRCTSSWTSWRTYTSPFTDRAELLATMDNYRRRGYQVREVR